MEKFLRCKLVKNRRNLVIVLMQFIYENGEIINISNFEINISDLELDILFLCWLWMLIILRQCYLSGSIMMLDSCDFLESSVFSSMSDLSLDLNG